MKISILLFISCLLTGISGHTQQVQTAKENLLRHVVIFKFKETSSKADIEKVITAFAGLPKQIKEIKSFEWGINESPENYHQGFTHCFVLTFASAKDRDEIYQQHPAHKAFQDVLKPHMEKVFVVDYWTR